MIKLRRIRSTRHVARTRRRGMHIEGKKPLGRRKRRWVDNIKMNLREIGWNGLDWIDLAQDRDQWKVIVNTLMNLLGP
jgi:hypothetical protein